MEKILCFKKVNWKNSIKINNNNKIKVKKIIIKYNIKFFI